VASDPYSGLALGPAHTHQLLFDPCQTLVPAHHWACFVGQSQKALGPFCLWVAAHKIPHCIAGHWDHLCLGMALLYRQGLLGADALVEVDTTWGLTAASGGWRRGPADSRWEAVAEEQTACCTGHC